MTITVNLHPSWHLPSVFAALAALETPRAPGDDLSELLDGIDTPEPALAAPAVAQPSPAPAAARPAARRSGTAAGRLAPARWGSRLGTGKIARQGLAAQHRGELPISQKSGKAK
jgi:hypothetical protein